MPPTPRRRTPFFIGRGVGILQLAACGPEAWTFWIFHETFPFEPGKIALQTVFTSPRESAVDEHRMEILVRLLTRHQEELFRFILAMHPHEEDARDILQETSVALCRKIELYDPEQPFLPWALGFAYLEVLKLREQNQRGTRLMSRDLMQRLAHDRESLEPILNARLQALETCLQKLSPTDRELVRSRYVSKVGIEEMVEQSGASRRTLFRNLDRIRRQLFDCITQRVATMDAP